jgi:argininosuccinate synthase
MDPVMRDIESFLAHSQENVTGKVFIELMPYRYQVLGIESTYDLMNSKFGKYGEMNTGFSGEDVRGFSKIFGNQTIIWNAVQKENNK